MCESSEEEREISFQDWVEFVVKSSIQVFSVNPAYPQPEAFGSGCVIIYRGGRYFLSVRHVTDNGLATCVETGYPPEDGRTILKTIRGLVYYSTLQFNPHGTPEELLRLIDEGGVPLDITFAKLSDELGLLQEGLSFPDFTIQPGRKIALNGERLAHPDQNNVYGFFGCVRHRYINGRYLDKERMMHCPIQYHRTSGNFHIFLTPEIIQNVDDYRGCSGAPIIGNDGNLVGLACKVRPNTRMIYGFSMQECLRLLDIAIDTGQFEFDNQEAENSL